ncbi:MAG: hypothetical protein AAGE96_21195 [Cyanobacteria bacterium P01_G01_bin.19]
MKTLCPICSGVLLRHLGHSRIRWFCPGCHQEMPNLDSFKFHNVGDKFQQFDKNSDSTKNNCIKIQGDLSLKTIKHNSEVINIFANQNKQRLEVVGFILSQINIILVTTLIETNYNTISKAYKIDLLNTSKNQNNIVKKTCFLRDSELILLYICQAILIADDSILSSKSLLKLVSKSINLKYSIEQSYFIYLIKTSVIDFIRSISVDSAQNINSFTSEVVNYFEIVVRSIIEFQQSKESY